VKETAMSRREPTGSSGHPSARVRAYLRRFVTCWVAEDPDPVYSPLDHADGLGQVPDPICEPRVQLPESAEVAAYQVHRGRPVVGRR
jgi:hypothetical protein